MAHTYIIGQSGSGKSTLMKQRIVADMKAGNGVCFIDPHGYDTDELIQYVPKHRIKDTVLFDPTDPDYVFTWNPLSETDNLPLAASTFADTIKDAWGYHGMTTPVMDMYLYFTVASLIESGGTLYDSLDLLLKEQPVLNDEVLNRFWDSYNAMTPKERREATASTLNKLFTLFGDPRIRNVLGHHKGQFTLSDTVQNKILFVRLPQGQLGMSKVSLLGSILLSQLHLACFKRDTTVPFKVYIDEVHSFAPSILAEMLAGLRKFNVDITVAHQFIDQVDRNLYSSLMGNCTERLAFRVSPEDAARLQEHLGKNAVHFNLDEIDPFRYRSLPYRSIEKDSLTIPLEKPDPNIAAKVKYYTQHNYCRRK